MAIAVSSQFDSGNIEVVAVEGALLRLRIRQDTHAGFMQWFHFRLHGVAGQALDLRIENAGQCSYAEGWQGYRCVASYDRKHWFRIDDTSYDGEQLRICFTPAHATVWLAYFEPYSQERHQDLIARAAVSPGVEVLRLGSSVEGRDLDLVRVGEPAEGRRKVWIIARQHPGEAMAEWFMEGFIERLLDASDPVARELRRETCLYLVPDINPDGAFRGNLRANAAGANLNREWKAPSLVRSPEVWHTQQAMIETGVDLFLDIHGDETLPYVFIDGSHMVPDYGGRNLVLQEAFLQDLLAASPDFQREHGYADNRFDDELLTLASKWVAHRFGCVGLTLEMPFKDNADAQDAVTGWNGARSKRLGAAMLQPVLQHVQRMQTVAAS